MSANQKVLQPEVEILVYQNEIPLASKKLNRFPILIGRAVDCHFQIDSQYMSRHHCEIRLENEQFVLADLDSRNGISVKGNKISQIAFHQNIKFEVEKVHVEIRVLNLPAPEFSDEKTADLAIPTPVHVMQAPTSRPPPPGAATRTSPLQKAPSRIATPPPPKPQKARPSTEGKAVAMPLPPIPESRAIAVPLPPKEKKEKKPHGDYHSPITSSEFRAPFADLHPRVMESKSRKLEAVLMWKGQVYEVREFFQNDHITVGAHAAATLRVPSLPKGWALGKAHFQETRCYVPFDRPATLVQNGQRYELRSLGNSAKVQTRKTGFLVKFNPTDVLQVELGSEMKLILRYVPTPAEIPRKEMFEPDWAIKRYMAGSALIHGLIALTLWWAAPEAKNVPKIPNVSERYARLLVDPPKPVLPVPEPPPPPPAPEVKPPPPAKMEVVKKPTPEIPKMKPKKVVQEKAKKPEKVLPQKSPVKEVAVSEKPIAQPEGAKNPPPPEVVKAPPNLGALGALGALGPTSTVNNAPSATPIKIEKGGKGVATGGSGPAMPNMPKISGGGGALVAGGTGVLKTKLGDGVGGEYGTKGLKAKAGSRGVAGAVVGAPLLAAGGGKEEGLTRKQVMDVVQKHLAQVQTCYEKSLLSTPDLSGRIEFDWDIQSSGSVSAVRVKRSTVTGGDGLSECVKGVFKKMKFPSAKNGQSTTPNIGFPFGRM